MEGGNMKTKETMNKLQNYEQSMTDYEKRWLKITDYDKLDKTQTQKPRRQS